MNCRSSTHTYKLATSLPALLQREGAHRQVPHRRPEYADLLYNEGPVSDTVGVDAVGLRVAGELRSEKSAGGRALPFLAHGLKCVQLVAE